MNYSDFVVSAITELLEVGSVVDCPFPPVVVNPLSVSVQSNGKKRLILDIRHVNFFVKKSKSFLQCLSARPTTWACSFDIKSSYHHIEIFESDQEFLGFLWVFESVTKHFKFTVLPFGLSVGPYIFSKVMRPLVRYWRSKALSNVVYLDDGISAAQSFSKCEEHSLLVRSDLFKSGFVPNKRKCQWVPLQGIFWDFFFGGGGGSYIYTSRKDFSKLCHAGAFLQGNLLLLPGELFQIFLSWVMFASS